MTATLGQCARSPRETRWTGSGARLDHSIAERRPFDGADHSQQSVAIRRRSSRLTGMAVLQNLAGALRTTWPQGTMTPAGMPAGGGVGDRETSSACLPTRFPTDHRAQRARPQLDRPLGSTHGVHPKIPNCITCRRTEARPAWSPNRSVATESVDDMPPSVSRHRRIAIDPQLGDHHLDRRWRAQQKNRPRGDPQRRRPPPRVSRSRPPRSRGNARVRDQPFDDKCFTKRRASGLHFSTGADTGGVLER